MQASLVNVPEVANSVIEHGPKSQSSLNPCIEGKQSRKRKLLLDTNLDHTYAVRDSPRTVNLKLSQTRDIMQQVQKKLKKCHKITNRLRIKVKSLTSVVHELENKNLVSTSCAELLKETLNDIPLEIMQRIVSQKGKKISRK